MKIQMRLLNEEGIVCSDVIITSVKNKRIVNVTIPNNNEIMLYS